MEDETQRICADAVSEAIDAAVDRVSPPPGPLATLVKMKNGDVVHSIQPVGGTVVRVWVTKGGELQPVDVDCSLGFDDVDLQEGEGEQEEEKQKQKEEEQGAGGEAPDGEGGDAPPPTETFFK